MIVPFSIAFGQRQTSVRSLFNRLCSEISLRHYDNRPDTTFNASPTVQSPENRQRATILTAVMGKNKDPLIQSSGLQRWAAEDRSLCLIQRPRIKCPSFRRNVDSRLSGQWPRIPTAAVADMIKAILDQKSRIENYQNRGCTTIALPQTAYQFISAIPQGSVSPRSENFLTFADMDTVRLVMATLNGHIAYGWWWTFGDAFHLKPYDMISLTVPDAWMNNPRPAIDMGQRLIESIPDCTVEMLNRGTIWKNVNFHLKPELIEELDRLHIAALDLPEEPLLTHLRIMRSSSSWDYSRNHPRYGSQPLLTMNVPNP